MDVYYKELRHEQIEQQKAYGIIALLCKYTANIAGALRKILGTVVQDGHNDHGNDNWDNLCDFLLFSFLYINPFLKRAVLKKKRINSKWVGRGQFFFFFLLE